MASMYLLAVSALVPASQRRRWLEEWRGESWHAFRRSPWPEPRPAPRGFALLAGALLDAATLRRERLRPGRFAAIPRVLMDDALYAVRALRARPRMVVSIVVTLALGIGTTTSIFALADAVLFRALPYADAEQLVAIRSFRAADGRSRNLSYADFRDLRAAAEGLEEVAAYRLWFPAMSGDRENERLNGLQVTHDLLAVLRMAPAIGRGFGPEDDVAGAAPVALLTHPFWQHRYQGREDVLGEVLVLNGTAHVVVGVMPPDFSFPPPLTYGTVSIPTDTDVLVALGPVAAAQDRGTRAHLVVGRLLQGTTRARAAEEVESIGQRLAQLYPRTNRGFGLALIGLREDVIAHVKPALTVLLAAALTIGMLTASNAASLLLTHVVGRSKESVVRAALGGGYWRLIRQFVLEGQLLATAGAVPGVCASIVAVNWLRSASPQDLPRAASVGVDLRVVAFASLLTVGCGLVCGLVAGAASARGDLMTVLRSENTTAGAGVRALRYGLVSLQIALSVTLLVAAGLVGTSFVRKLTLEPGFDPRAVVTARVELPPDRYPDDAAVAGFFERLVDELAALPGVLSAGSSNSLPTDPGTGIRVVVADRPETHDEVHRVRQQVIDEQYLGTMRIPIVAGRPFDVRDDQRGRQVAMVNETMAARYWPGESAIGKRIAFGSWRNFPTGGTRTDDVEREVVGVVADTRNLGGVSPEPSEPVVYVPYAQDPWRIMSIVVRSRDDPELLVPAIRRATRSIDASQVIDRSSTLSALLSNARRGDRFNAGLLGGFAVAALLLATIGIYSTVSVAVAYRTRELGIRKTLGADRSRLVRMMSLQIAPACIGGVAVGLLWAWAVSGYLRHLLFDTAPTDIGVFVGAGLIITLSSLAATVLPASRAAGLEPTVALRR